MLVQIFKLKNVVKEFVFVLFIWLPSTCIGIGCFVIMSALVGFGAMCFWKKDLGFECFKLGGKVQIIS